MLRRIFGFLLLLAVASPAFSQIYNPVSWEFSHEKVSDDTYKLTFKANIEKGWSIYSQYLENDDGPIPTSFQYDEGDHFEIVGKNEEGGKKKEEFDKIFEMNLIKFYEKGTFTQQVKISDFSKPITGYLTFMTCDDSKCLPPKDVDFSFDLSAEAPAAKPEKKEKQPAKDQTDGGTGKASQGATDASTIAAVEQETDGEAASDMLRLTAKEKKGQLPGGMIDPVSWMLDVQQVEGDVYEVKLSGKINEGWNIYSQDIDAEPGEGPVATEFFFNPGDHFETMGPIQEQSSKSIKEFDKNFEMELVKLKKNVQYSQRIRVKDTATPVEGGVYFMSCDATKCLPPREVPFTIDLQNKSLLLGEEPSEATAAPGLELSTLQDAEVGPTGRAQFAAIIKESKEPVGACTAIETKESSGSLWNIFALGFIGGLIALLTPCVFPMIPLTVSFFTKSSGDRRKGIANATLYGFFILLVYLLLSVPFHLLDSVNPNILNDISTNIWLNIAFFAIFLFFAFSFFGYYELTLPSSWSNKASSAEGIGGVMGIFFMALTLALVSFSCTGPILGSLLAGALSAEGGAMQLTAGMGGFGLALALPFALFAAFPSVLNSLPKSGGWLNTVKVVLGFAELALAFKFLSNADLVKHWGLLKVEPFLAIWILVAIGLALYLFGKIRFPHDSPNPKIGPTRIGLGLASVAFAAYLATGFIYDQEAGSLRPLKLLSGLAPPACYSWFYPCDCPQNLNCFKDFEEGMAYAKENNKPVIVDFSGHACVNCRKMEEHVWPQKEVYDMLEDDYVLISLYVDEKIDLPEEQQGKWEYSSGGALRIRQTGHKWQYLQTEFFGNNSQPWYVLLSPDGRLLNQPVGYTPDEKEYAKFLRCGLENYQELESDEGLLGDKLEGK